MAEYPALLMSGDVLNQGSHLNGRRWAGKTLMHAWAAQHGSQPLHLACSDPSLTSTIQALTREAGHRGEIQMHGLVDPSPYGALGGLFIPDPSIGRWARWRQAIGAERFSLIGQIHTLNTPAALGHLEALASEPIQPWDALICTSTAGRSVVEAVFENREEQLQERFGIHTPLPRPQLPVIPLPIPVHTMHQQLPERCLARQQLHIPSNAHVCLWLGRLSLLTKLDPWPTYQLLQRVAGDVQQEIWLIECGADETPEQARHLDELRRLCPDVHFLRLGGALPVDETTKYQALAAADLALSLVDNCQETFGLSVIEAMAAGLPVVASDWDGYRDSIRHGVDGFLVPSRWAPGSDACSFRLGWQLQLELLSFPMVSGALGQLVQLNMPAARAHLATLLQNPNLARAMGQQGRRRAEDRFAGSVVMQQYEHLFSELAEQRRAHLSVPQKAVRPPLSLDPVNLFRHFASDAVDEAWPESEGSKVAAAVCANRQALWQPLLQGLGVAQRQQLLQELQRKHL